MVADHKLKGILDAGDKSSNHDSSSSQSPMQKRIHDLETLVQRLQHCLRIYEDPTTMKTFMDGVDEYSTKEEQDDMDEETVRPSQFRSFLERNKPKDKYARDYDYQKRYDERYHDEDYYERHNNEGLKFNPKLDISEFEERMRDDDFLDWLNTVESVFEYCDPPEHKKVKLVAIKMRKNASFWWENLKR